MKTVINTEEKTIFFSFEDFKAKIVEGNCCFICGAEASSKEFNDEHIIPNWVLHRFGLHKKRITLPNGTKFNYGQYKIPCCKDCNSKLGETFEVPISELLKKDFVDIRKELSDDREKAALLFNWLALIFFKTHLKDRTLEMNRDKRFNDGKIGDHHYWEDMHHIHCLIRSFYTGAEISPEVYGTMLIFPIADFEHDNLFDYIDTPYGKVAMIRIGSFCMIIVIDDCRGSLNVWNDLRKLKGSLNSYQIREIIAHLNAININLKNRPAFKSLIRDNGEGKYTIFAQLPPLWELKEEQTVIEDRSFLLHHYISIKVELNDHNLKVLQEIKMGHYSFLFNERGEFLSNE
ncbi:MULTISPECIES: hypothetical protein [Flavobacterium]|uniref:hypothetical protein n=1 Tax=Flavobacterium TaxID=237 RepID=UPI0009219F32|nr:MULTISPECIES: hypothetical protein [Flavobacterium]MBJ2124335.1 hypothetical protein [Flavobacterium sp. IB48]OXA74265.1 hypothetical protein B0A67_00305 [Flavobacterium aquidurense]SHF90940.1 hypothetical protein SAMN05444481_10162 [Flavobacterium frigidimaris]